MMGARDEEQAEEDSNFYNQISAKIGPTGRWQRQIMCLLFIPTFLVGANEVMFFFITGRPDHFRCLVPLCDFTQGQHPISPSPSYNQAWLNNVLKLDEAGFEQCRARRILTREQCFQGLNITAFTDEMLETCSDWVYDTSTFTSTAVTKFNLVCSRHYLRASMGSLRSLFSCIGSVATTYLSDRYGRKNIMVTCTFLTLAFHVGTALANTFEIFTFFVIAAKMVCSGLYAVPIAYVMEIMDESIGANCALILNIFHILGTLTCTGLAWLFRDYATLILATNIPFCILAMLMFNMPESPMWLLSFNRREEAIQVVRAAAKVNGIYLRDEELSKLERNLMKSDERKRVNATDIFKRSKTLQMRLVLVTLAFCAVDYVYHGLSFNTGNLKGNLYLNYFLDYFVESPSTLYSNLLLNRMGRKFIMTSSLFLSGTILMSAVLVPNDDGLQWIKVALSVVGKLPCAAAHEISYIQMAELFPTDVRATVYGVTEFFSNLAGAFSPFLTDLKVSGHEVRGDDFWRSQFPFLMFGTLSFVAAALFCLLPSTDRVGLPDTVEDAEKIH